MNIISTTFNKLFGLFALLFLAISILSACGGGGGGDGSSIPASSTLGGVAAVGYPIANGSVQIMCADGSTLSSNTPSTGAWQVTISGQALPCAIQISGGTINGVANTISYQSIATSYGTVNITPLTNFMVANLAGTATPDIWFAGLTPAALASITPTMVNTALANLRNAFSSSLAPLISINPITSSFSPSSGNAMDDMLAALQMAMTNAGVSYATLLNSASTGNFILPAGFGTALSTAYSTVTAPVLTAIVITPPAATVTSGLTTKFTATGTYSDTSTADITSQVTWATGNTGVATINTVPGVATGVSVGNTTVTASMNGIASPAANLSVIAPAPVITAISISPTTPSVPMGTPVIFTATGTFSNGSSGNISGAVTWSSTNTAVATLNTTGVASALTQGITTVTASANGVTSNSAVLTVVAPIPFALKSGDVLVTDSHENAIFAVDPLTGKQTLIASILFDNFDGIVIEPSGNILVTSGNVIKRINSVTFDVSTVWNAGNVGLGHLPDGIAVNSEGTIFVSGSKTIQLANISYEEPAIWRIDPITGVQSLVTSGGYIDSQISGLAVHPNGLLYATVYGGAQITRLLEIDPNSGTQTKLTMSVFNSGAAAASIEIDQYGNLYIPLETGADQVWRVDGSTYIPTQIYFGGYDVTDVAVNFDGDVFVTVYEQFYQRSKLWRIDGQTGNASILTYSNPFQLFTGVAVVP